MKTVKFNTTWITAVVLATCFASTNVMAQTSPKEAQAVAQEAFIYASPLMFNYKTLYQYT